MRRATVAAFSRSTQPAIRACSASSAGSAARAAAAHALVMIVLFRLALGSQKNRFVGRPRLRPLGRLGAQPVADRLSARGLLVGAGGERPGGEQQPLPVDLGIGAGRAADVFGARARGQAEHPVDRRDQPLDLAAVLRQQRAEPQPGFAQRGEPFGERGLAEQHGQTLERKADLALRVGQDLRLRLAQQIGSTARVEHVEMRHHARLEREALEQRLAEAVDGHDRQAGGQVEDLGQQRPRARLLLRRSVAAEQPVAAPPRAPPPPASRNATGPPRPA